MVSEKEIDSILRQPETWYLNDTIPDPGNYPCIMVLVASPKKENFKQFSKYDDVTTFYMPVWDYQELENFPTIFPLNSHVLNDKFLKFGGVPRLIFKDDQAEAKLEQALAR